MHKLKEHIFQLLIDVINLYEYTSLLTTKEKKVTIKKYAKSVTFVTFK